MGIAKDRRACGLEVVAAPERVWVGGAGARAQLRGGRSRRPPRVPPLAPPRLRADPDSAQSQGGVTHLQDFSWWVYIRRPPRGGAPGAVGFPVRGVQMPGRTEGGEGHENCTRSARGNQGSKSRCPVGVPT